jgi:integrase
MPRDDRPLSGALAGAHQHVVLTPDHSTVIRAPLGRYVRPAVAAVAIRLTVKAIERKIEDGKWIEGREYRRAAKSANNYLIPLRGVFAFECAGPRAAMNPMTGIKNLKVVKKLPDPLTAAERDRILTDMTQHDDPRIVAYFRFAFFTGLRPEELIALRWEDVDEAAQIVRVQRVRTFKGSERDGSKTHAERDVELVPEALAALKAMKPYTAMKRDDRGEPADIFENPVTGRTWHDERSQRDHYWKPALKRLKIRTRRCHATRHTYATVALMGGFNPACIEK